MPVDSSIALQTKPIEVPDQIAQYGRLLQLQGLQGQQKMQALQLGQAQSADAENTALKTTLAGIQPDSNGSYDLQSLAPKLMAVSPTQGAALVKNFGEINNQQTQQRKNQIEGALKQLDFIGQVASGVTDQASYDQAKTVLQKNNIDISQMPPNYDPNAVKMNQMRALSIKDRLAQEHEALTLAETKRHNQSTEGNQAAELDIKRQQLNQGKITPGYRPAQDGKWEPIPGGPADLKLQGAFNQDTAALNGSISSFDRLATAANEVLNSPGLAGITGLRGAIPNVPGSEAANAQALLGTLKSQVGFGVLQDMRNNSKTGGALGAVSDAEGKRLEANLASLEKSQSLDQLKSNLQKIIEYSQGAKDRLGTAYNLKHGNQTYGGNTQPAPTATQGAPALQNAKGWTLHTDAQGNKAYVSPDNKQFEAVP